MIDLIPILAHGGAAEGAGPLQEALGYLGRFHVLVVHFPIALVLTAFLAEIASRKWPEAQLDAVAGWCSVFGALGALAAILLGWFYADFGGHHEASPFLFWHKWLGIAAALTSCAAAWVWRQMVSRGEPRSQLFLALLGLSAVLVGVTAHFGGAMIHGGDFLVP